MLENTFSTVKIFFLKTQKEIKVYEMRLKVFAFFRETFRSPETLDDIYKKSVFMLLACLTSL